MYPKECINNNCTTIFFVEYYQLIQCLQCGNCIDKL